VIGYHNSQYQPGASLITRQAGCTWTTGATGVAVVTGGRYAPTPDKIHSLVKRTEETSPTTPGWSLADLDLALSRFGMGFEVHIGQGWDAVEKNRPGRFLVIQGDSDQFGNGTCSGAFDGSHCIGVDGSHTKVDDGVEYWWIHDPICPTGRWERKNVIRRYAEKLAAMVFFGWFTQRIPKTSWRWVNQPDKGTKEFARFIVKGGVIVDVEHYPTRGMDVACTPPKAFEAAPGKPDGWSRDLVTLLIPGKKRNGWKVDARFAHKES